MSEIHERIAALEAQLAELKQEVAAPEGEVSTSRRDVFKKLALGAAGVAAGGALLGKATPAAAADGQAVLMGTEAGQNVAASATRLNYTGAASTAAVVVQSGTTYSATQSNRDAALAGWASSNGTLDTGVYGYSERGTGVGVVGWSDTVVQGIGVLGRGVATQSVGGQFQGGRAAVNVVSNGAEATIVTNIANVKKGDLVFSNEGNLWVSDEDGSLVRLGGASTAAANGLYFLNAPARAYDSRSSTGIGFGPLNAAGGARAVSLATGTAGGATVAAVPAGATGALISVTLDATVGSGFLAIFAGDISWPGNSNANWYATGQILAVTTVSVVDATSKINLQVGGGGSTQVIVDVIGYYA